MVIEFQIIRSRLEQLLHERIIAARPCILQPFSMLNTSYYVVGIDIGTTKLAIADEETWFGLNTILGGGNIGVPIIDTVTVTLRRLQLEQKVDVLVASETTLRDANTEPPSVLHIGATVVFDLIVTVNDDGRPRFCARVADIRDLDLPDSGSEAEILATIEDHFDNCANFGLGALAQMAGGVAPVVINAGIAATPNLSRIAIRFDTANNAASAAPGWTEFFAGSFPSLLGTNEWALLLPHELMIPSMLERFEEQLGKAEKFNLDSGPGGSWVPLGPIPRIKVTFAGELEDACVGIDVDVDVTLWVGFVVPQPDVLRASVSLSWDGDFWEELACELLATQFFPIVGAMFLDEGKMKWWQFALGLVLGPAAVFTAAVVYLSTDEPAKEMPDPPPDWVEDSATEWHQDIPFPTTFGDLATGLTLAGAFATSAGLVMTGKINVLSPLAPTLAVNVTGFSAWHVERPCTDPFGAETEAKVAYWADPMGPTPRLPLQVCEVRVVNDPLGQYTTFATVNKVAGALMSSASTTFTISNLLPEFRDNPYPLQVLVQSNNGVRWLTIQPPPPSIEKPDTDEEWKEFQQAYLKWKAQHCWLTSSIWGILGVFNPKWLIDPPHDEVYAQAWWLMPEGLAEGESVTLRDRLGRDLGTARADRSGRAEVSAVLEHARAETGVMIGRGGASMTPEEWERRAGEVSVPTAEPRGALRIKQVLLVQLAEVSLVAPAQLVTMDFLDGVPALRVETPLGLATYSLAEPRNPERVPGGASVRSTKSCKPEEQVLGRAAAGGYTYVLAADGMHVFDGDGCELARLRISGARGLTLVRERLVVATDEGVAVFDISQPGVLKPGGVHRLPDVAGVQRAPVASARSAVYARQSGDRGVVLDVGDPQHPTMLAEYARRPWYADSARLGRLYARLDDARRRVTIYRLGESAIGFEKPPLASEIWSRGRPTR